MPHPQIDFEILGISEDAVELYRRKLAFAWASWGLSADARGLNTIGELQYLAQRMTVQFGEWLFLLPMIKRPDSRYSLAVQAVNPTRLRTPSDMINRTDIRDGIEVNEWGRPVAYWIKTLEGLGSDTSANFMRYPAMVGHRRFVLHWFHSIDPEQYRGVSPLAPAMKFFRDLSDYLDAELVSNVVTAAFALFIELGQDINPLYPATDFSTDSETIYKVDGSSTERRYQEMVPGQIMYGNPGEKPHPISAQRPGSTFGVFVKTIQKALAMSVGIPHPVLFKDFEGMNYASYRSAMLEAWRVFTMRRRWQGQAFCQPIYNNLVEEAYLMGDLDPGVDFYANMPALTACEWIGPPKGQIEPVKEVQGDILAIQHNLKTRTETALEQGRDWSVTVKKLGIEQRMMESEGLDEQPVDATAGQEQGQEGQDGSN